MVNKVDQKLSSRPVDMAGLLDFINRELVPTVEKIRLAQDALLDLVYSGEGDPEGVVEAGIGSLYQRTDGSVGTSVYYKSMPGNTGWLPVP